jgi:integrase
MTRITVAPNELAIKALRCPDDRPRMVVHLEGHGNAGLKLYVERSGTKSWYYRARVMGSGSREMPLGRWPDVSIAAARQRKADAVAAISGGQDPWRERKESQRRRHGITLDVVFEEWGDAYGKEKRTWVQDELRYRMNIKGGHRFKFGKWKDRTHKTGIGHLVMADITRLDVSGCLSDVRKRSPSQAHQTLILLNTVFKWARAMGYIETNPVEGQPFYRRKEVRDRYLSEDEIRVFWHALETDPHIMPTTRICLRLLLLTGSRRDDWAEASKFELQDGCLVVPAERYKGKRIHRIPLAPLAQQQVNAALRLDPKSEWLFPSLGAFGPKSTAGRMNSAVVTESMGRLMTRLSIPHATPHSLRHTVGSHLDRLGYALEEIGLALGHTLRGTTAGYIHDKDGRRAAIRRRPILEAWEREVMRLVMDPVLSEVVRTGSATDVTGTDAVILPLHRRESKP